MKEQLNSKVEEGAKMEGEPKKEEFDKFLVPMEWFGDITEAKKDAYRMRVLAHLEKFLSESKIASMADPFGSRPREKTTDGEPLPEDYENATILYQQIYGPMPTPDNKLDKVINKYLELMGGTWMKAFVELRARMLAHSDIKEFKKKQENQ